MSMSTIDRLYSSLINDIDYKDLPEAEKARDKVKACIMNGYLSKDTEEARKQWLELEKMIADIACANEHQGFIYGFRLAMGLFIGNERPYGKSQFEEHIRSEYSTLMVSDLDRTDQVVDILKEHTPESRLEDAINTLCACVNDTKYAVFEQGFLRGIAVARGERI